MIIKKIDPEPWSRISENVHRACFGTYLPISRNRIDYALLVIDGKLDVPLGYVTVRETDEKTAYWQFGGAFPGPKGTARVFRGYMALLDWMRASRYELVTMKIVNTNTSMLRMALKAGFQIVGTKIHGGHTLVECEKEMH